MNVVAKGRSRQRLSTRLAVPPVASARGEIGIPREPTSNTPKHVVPALDLRREPSLNGTPATDGPSRPEGQPYPRFALLATLFIEAGGRPQGGDAGGGAIFPAVAADKTDQPGVLGNLPRSRPGQRSQKRAASRPAAAAASAAKPEARSGSAAKRAAARKRKPPAAAPRRERAAPEPAPASNDPLSLAFRTAGKIAELGLKTAGGILRRIPGR
jgi:hypothetical protein